MVLPAPNLDDRTFDDLVEGALAIVRRQCPEWDAESPSDPGRTLIEVMAWLTETVIYRLNRVPDKSYVRFLDLLGIRMRPAQPARTWVVFDVVAGVSEASLRRVPAASRLETAGSGPDVAPIRFETIDDLDLTAAKISGLVSLVDTELADHRSLLSAGAEAQEIFCGRELAPHCLYLGGPSLALDAMNAERHGEQLEITWRVDDETPAHVRFEWDFYGVDGWTPLVPRDDDTGGLRRSGRLVFDLPPLLQRTTVLSHEGFWLRARAIELGDEAPRVTALTRGFVARRNPGAVSVRRPPDPADPGDPGEVTQLTSMDFPAVVRPFGSKAIAGSEMRVASPLFARAGALVTLAVRVQDELAFEDLRDVELHWSCWVAGDRWETLGVSSAKGVLSTDFGLRDETDAFGHTGRKHIQFRLPDQPQRLTVDGVDGFWIRVRIASGSYGLGGLAAPVLTELHIECREPPAAFESALTLSEGSWQDLTAAFDGSAARPLFLREPGRQPTFCIGLSEQPPSNKRCRILLDLADSALGAGTLSWEYSSDRWRPLRGLNDGTQRFTRSGIVEFLAPEDWQPLTLGTEHAYWIRARWQAGEAQRRPRLAGAYINAVEALQATSTRQYRLGSSSGLPGQRFALHEPVLDGISLAVREVSLPSDDPSAQSRARTLLDDPRIDCWQAPDGIWVRYLETTSFLMAGPDARVFLLDAERREVRFGDGQLGHVPPPGGDNVVIERCYVGGGPAGNVPAMTIRRLLDALPAVDKVYNPVPASGGAAAETLDRTKQRAPRFIRSQDRAVTSQDFEVLAREASAEVARVSCLQTEAGLKLVIVPHADARVRAPFPGPRLLDLVRRHLDARRLLNVELDVTGPSYVPVDLSARVVVLASFAENLGDLRTQLQETLRRFVHPLFGRDGQGWTMGRALPISELYHTMEHLEFVDYVEDIVVDGDPSLRWIEVPPLGYPLIREAELSLELARS